MRPVIRCGYGCLLPNLTQTRASASAAAADAEAAANGAPTGPGGYWARGAHNVMQNEVESENERWGRGAGRET